MHLLFWGGYLSLSVFVFSGREEINRALLISSVLIVPQIIIAYFNMEVLIVFFFKNQYLKYFGLVLLCFVGFYLFYEFVLPEIFKRKSVHHPNSSETLSTVFQIIKAKNFRAHSEECGYITHLLRCWQFIFCQRLLKTSQIASLKREKEGWYLKGENLNSEL